MITSLFYDSFCTEINYSEREDCLLVVDLPLEDVQKLRSGMDYKIVKGKLTIYEGEKWQAIIDARNAQESEAREKRKSDIREELGNLNNQLQGAKMLGDDTAEIQAKIDALKAEYATL